ncbi:hypothetical protein AAFF_G00125390 [Aldrovandia affinis]|uniref:Tumor necrosis factor receptor superfamily member 1A-like n=1 Tax=Aldrovandia affinis TaxID=143900 RepID=A0AAD7W9Z4_9TELE|nr:hypothetical protein AAFF_G00125390 [Aldrovandia affinis]
MKFSSWIFLWIVRVTVASLAPHGGLSSDTPDPQLQSLGRYPRGDRLRRSLSQEPADVCKAVELDTDPNKCCKLCPPGYHKSSECGNEGVRCSRCGGGTFTEIENRISKCERCHTCDKGVSNIVEKQCTSDRNAKCGCLPGYYILRPTTTPGVECRKCTVCSNRNESVACSKNQNAQCGACHLDFYEDSQKNCRACEKQEYLRPACQHFLTTTHPTPETTSKGISIPAATEAGPPQPPLVVFLSVVVLMMMGALLCCILYYCTCCGRGPLPWNLGKTQKQAYKMWPGLARDKASPALPDLPCENHKDPSTVESKPPPLRVSEKDGPHDASTETLVISFKCSPATALLQDANPKMLREEPPQTDSLASAVLYTIIREVPVRRWKEFLRLLSVSDGQMERVELDAGPCYLEQQYQMLRLWSQTGGAALEAVYAALHAMNLSGCAQKLQEKLELLQQQAIAAAAVQKEAA